MHISHAGIRGGKTFSDLHTKMINDTKKSYRSKYIQSVSVGRLESKPYWPLNKCIFDIFLLEIPPELMVGVDKVISHF